MIGIVLPTYNGERYLSATLDSVLAQTHSDWRLIAVDDGSSDNTADVLERYCEMDERIRAVRQVNSGVATARNRGLGELPPDADMVAFLDHDDLWEPHTLETLRQALQACPAAPAAHGVAYYIDAEGRRTRPGDLETGTRRRCAVQGTGVRRVPITEPTTFACMAVFCVLTTPGQALIRRTALDGIGPLDQEMAPSDDWDMWLRITAALEPSLGLAFVDREVLGFRIHGGNQSGNHVTMAAAMLRVRRKLIASSALTPDQHAMLRAGHRRAFRAVAGMRVRWAASCAARGRLIAASKHLRHAAFNLVEARAALDVSPPSLAATTH